MVYMGTPYIFYKYVITCGWLGNYIDTGNEYFGRLLDLDSECRGIQF